MQPPTVIIAEAFWQSVAPSAGVLSLTQICTEPSMQCSKHQLLACQAVLTSAVTRAISHRLRSAVCGLRHVARALV